MAVDFRYRHIGYVALNVTDVDRTTAFAGDTYGLDVAGDGPNGERFFRCGTEHHSLVLYQAGEPAFVGAGWELETEDDVEKAWRHVEGLGLNPKRVGEEERAALGLQHEQRVPLP